MLVEKGLPFFAHYFILFNSVLHQQQQHIPYVLCARHTAIHHSILYACTHTFDSWKFCDFILNDGFFFRVQWSTSYNPFFWCLIMLMRFSSILYFGSVGCETAPKFWPIYLGGAHSLSQRRYIRMMSLGDLPRIGSTHHTLNHCQQIFV